MKRFEESKHPRDNDGKFTDKGGVNSGAGEAKRIFELAEKLGIEYNKNTSYQTVKARVEQAQKAKRKKISLSKQEWAQYYKALGDEKHGNFVFKTKSGQRVVRLDDKIVIDNGDFENPRIQNVWHFRNSDVMDDLLNDLVIEGVIF